MGRVSLCYSIKEAKRPFDNMKERSHSRIAVPEGLPPPQAGGRSFILWKIIFWVGLFFTVIMGRYEDEEVCSVCENEKNVHVVRVTDEKTVFH